MSGLPFLTPGDLPNPEMEPRALAPPALADGFFTTCATWKAKGTEGVLSLKVSIFIITLNKNNSVFQDNPDFCLYFSIIV